MKHGKGEFLPFLNNDVEVINEGWPTEMVSHGLRKHVGCVGAKLLYPDDTNSTRWCYTRFRGVAGHAFRQFPKSHTGDKNRLNLVQNYSAVTGACLLIRKKIFEQVSGFDEEKLKVAFNDIDLCLKVKQLGYFNLWTPNAMLYHHESASRGSDLAPEKRRDSTRKQISSKINGPDGYRMILIII